MSDLPEIEEGVPLPKRGRRQSVRVRTLLDVLREMKEGDSIVTDLPRHSVDGFVRRATHDSAGIGASS